MTEDGIKLALGAYLLIGLAFLFVLDAATGRIRRRLNTAARETQTKFVNTGQYIGHTASILITLFALWVLWPVAVYGAAERLLKNNDRKDK